VSATLGPFPGVHKGRKLRANPPMIKRKKKRNVDRQMGPTTRGGEGNKRAKKKKKGGARERNGTTKIGKKQESRNTGPATKEKKKFIKTKAWVGASFEQEKTLA